MNIENVGLMSPGDMGQAVAIQIKAEGLNVYTALEQRSERTRVLAREAGITDAGKVGQLVAECDVVLSIINPGAAVDFPLLGFKPPSSDGDWLESMSYSTGSHTVFYHRYHIVWITKYRYKVLQGKLRERVRDIIRQVCREMDVQIIEGVCGFDRAVGERPPTS